MMQNLGAECLEGQMWPPEGQGRRWNLRESVQDVVRLQTWQLCVEDGADGDRTDVGERRPREGLPAVHMRPVRTGSPSCEIGTRAGAPSFRLFRASPAGLFCSRG